MKLKLKLSHPNSTPVYNRLEFEQVLIKIQNTVSLPFKYFLVWFVLFSHTLRASLFKYFNSKTFYSISLIIYLLSL